MKVIDPGHAYQLNHLDGTAHTELVFVKRDGAGYPGNVGHHEGTNLQEVLRACIDRVKYLDNQIHDDENDNVLFYLRHAISHLEARAALRHGREWSVMSVDIELQPTCARCGHIGCAGSCHHC